MAILGTMTMACQHSSAVKESRVDMLPFYNEASFTPNWMTAEEVPTNFHRIRPFKLINQEGDTISERTFAGKIYVVDFFFTACPGICPKMTANMHLVQKEFLQDDEVLLLSHSVTPESDSVPTLKHYAEEKGVVTGKWHLVTGPRDVIYKLGRKDYFIEEDMGLQRKDDEFLHTENFVLIDHDLRIRGIYNGLNSSSVNQLIADIRLLKKAE